MNVETNKPWILYIYAMLCMYICVCDSVWWWWWSRNNNSKRACKGERGERYSSGVQWQRVKCSNVSLFLNSHCVWENEEWQERENILDGHYIATILLLPHNVVFLSLCFLSILLFQLHSQFVLFFSLAHELWLNIENNSNKIQSVCCSPSNTICT